MNNKEQVVFGVVGQAVSGKGEVVRAFVKRGFESYSLSDLIRELLQSINVPEDREPMIALGNRMREIFGDAILAQGVCRQVEASQSLGVVVESIRNPGEVRLLRKQLGAYIVGVTRSPEKRFAAMLDRNRSGDPKTWDDFLKLLATEKGQGEKSSGQQVEECLAMVDETISNEGTLEELSAAVGRLVVSKGSK